MTATAYAEDWKGLVKRGVTSYLEVLKNLKESRSYHHSRSTFSWEDDPPQGFPKLQIPLLWGTF